MMRFKTKSYQEYLSNASNTWLNETGTLNKSGMWAKGDAGKLAGIEWGVSINYLLLAGAITDRVSSRVFLTIMKPSNIYKASEKQNVWLSRIEFSSSSSGMTQSSYTKYMRELCGLMFPNIYANHSGGASNVCYLGYHAIQGYGSYTDNFLFYIYLEEPGNRKSLFNLKSNIYLNTSSLEQVYYGTYLTYVKGENEEWKHFYKGWK